MVVTPLGIKGRLEPDQRTEGKLSLKIVGKQLETTEDEAQVTPMISAYRDRLDSEFWIFEPRHGCIRLMQEFFI